MAASILAKRRSSSNYSVGQLSDGFDALIDQVRGEEPGRDSMADSWKAISF
jgi:hypothetical protein